MRAMTSSAVRLAREALAVGRAALPRYSCRQSRHDFTQAQLFALLVLRQELRLDYRGLVARLAEWGEVRRALGLAKVPHYSTLCYAARRLLADAEKGGPSVASSPWSSAARSRRGSSAARGSRPSTPPGSTRATQARTTATATRRATSRRTPSSTAAAGPPRTTGGRGIPS